MGWAVLGALHTEGSLGVQLKLQWAQAEELQGDLCRGHTARTVEAEVDTGWCYSYAFCKESKTTGQLKLKLVRPVGP